jgi:hypothetical protein
MDGNSVNIISNADASEMGEVARLIGKSHMTFPAPKCVAEYNKHMQGVDRLDQLRAKYSLADGHSMKKWHKKLALAFIDIARVNGYVTWKMRKTDSDKRSSRNEHRQFMIELVSEMISGKWKDSTDDEGMLFADSPHSSTATSTGSPRPPPPPPTPTTPACDFQMSSEVFPNGTRGKRGCKVCAFEGRPKPMKTNFCRRHNVCLCSQRFPVDPTLANLVCPYVDWDCWRKYHDYYLPRGLFNAQGRIKRSSTLHQARRKLDLVEGHDMRATSTPTFVLSPYGEVPGARFQYQSPHDPFVSGPFNREGLGLGTEVSARSEVTEGPTASPPTLIFSPFDGERANALHSNAQHQSPIQFNSSPVESSVSASGGTPAFSALSSTSTDYI